ncbi:MAG: hypothetical protein R3B95_07655 [Nitrospirales bacterium]|nr:hypothetical protein [Nitrospirales bacterium]
MRSRWLGCGWGVLSRDRQVPSARRHIIAHAFLRQSWPLRNVPWVGLSPPRFTSCSVVFSLFSLGERVQPHSLRRFTWTPTTENQSRSQHSRSRCESHDLAQTTVKGNLHSDITLSRMFKDDHEDLKDIFFGVHDLTKVEVVLKNADLDHGSVGRVAVSSQALGLRVGGFFVQREAVGEQWGITQRIHR